MSIVVPLAQQVMIPLDDRQLRSMSTPLPIATFGPWNWASTGTTVTVPWSEVLVSAILVGVRDWQARRQHGRFGDTEIWRRVLFILSHLDLQRSTSGVGVYRSPVYDAEDGSEKTASSYMVGMTTALLIARSTRTARALLHYDALHGKSGTRPDLVAAHNPDTDFYEAKGRYLPVRQAAMDDAVQQLHKHNLSAQTRYAAATATGFVAGRLVAHRQHWTRPVPTVRRAVPPTVRAYSAQMVKAVEPLVMALWSTATANPVDIVRVRYADSNLISARNPTLNLIVGLDIELFTAATAALRDEGIGLPTTTNARDPREYDQIDAEFMTRDSYLSDGVYVAWDTNVRYEQIPDAPDA